MTQLPAHSFAAMVYWVFIIGVVMIFSYFLESVYRISKKWFRWILLCPPLAMIFIIKNWDETKAAFFFFIGFYLVILFSGSLSGYRMPAHTTEILYLIFLWPIALYNYINCNLLY